VAKAASGVSGRYEKSLRNLLDVMVWQEASGGRK
jgi:hypothetical protein